MHNGDRQDIALQSTACVERWFGSEFNHLHPLLQALHRHGGMLQGEVQISFGNGLAGWLGRRLARKLGVPVGVERTGLQVHISHADGVLHWDRCFGGAVNTPEQWMRSRFEPVGQWPQGYWLERTGLLELHLGVDVVDSAWHWVPRSFKLLGMPLPAALMLTSRASKRVQCGQYVFEVHMSAPLLGMLLRYEGCLDIVGAT
jgi:Domain of unknown function (DUF4166)